MQDSVIVWECSQSRTPGLVSLGEFRSLVARLLWDLNQHKATGEGLQRMCQILKLDVSQTASVNISRICFKAKSDRSVYHENACFVLKRRSDSWSCSCSLCCQTPRSTTCQEQAAFPPQAQARQILRCSTAQHSSSCYADAEPEPWPQSCTTTTILHISLHQSHFSFYFSLLHPFFLVGISPPGFLPSIPANLTLCKRLEFTLPASLPKLVFKEGNKFHTVFWPKSQHKRFQRNVK